MVSPGNKDEDEYDHDALHELQAAYEEEAALEWARSLGLCDDADRSATTPVRLGCGQGSRFYSFAREGGRVGQKKSIPRCPCSPSFLI